MDRALTSYCRARETLKRAEMETREERAEQNDAQRTLSTLLGESMAKHGVPCVTLPSAEDGSARYVVLPKTTRRPCALRTDDDVLELVRDASKHVVGAEDIPNAVAELALSRARERGRDVTSRPRVITRPPARQAPPLRWEEVPQETRTFSEQFVSAVDECRTMRKALQPLRSAMRDATKTLAPLLPTDGTTSQVQVTRPTLPSAPSDDRVVLQLSRRDKTKTKSKALGVREMVELVREAASRAVRDDDADLDERLQIETRRVLEERRRSQEESSEAGVRVRVRRHAV